MTHTGQGPGAGDPGRIDARSWRMCWVIAMGAFASGLDAAVVNLGLDSISGDLHASLPLTQWVINGYLIALAVSLPPAAWCTRRFGAGRVWMASLAAFTIASILCAAAATVPWLIAARVLQGLAGGVLIPAGQTVLGEAVGPDRLGRVMGVLGIAVSAAPAIGPLLGGAILHFGTWPWLFLINLPIGVITLLLAWSLVPRAAGSGAQPLHGPGLTLISVGLPLLVWATSAWGQAGRPTGPAIAALAGAAILGGAFIKLSYRNPHPILNLRLYGRPGFRAAALAALSTGALVFGSGICLALYFELGRHQDQLRAGISLAGVAVATAITGPFAGRWIDRVGPGPVAITGGALAAAAVVPLAVLGPGAPSVIVQALLILFGVAVALAAMPVTVAAFRAVGKDQLADAITQVNILQRIGGAIGGTLCAVLIATDHSRGFRNAFTTLIVAAAVTLTAGLLITRSRPQPAPTRNETQIPEDTP